MQSINNEKAECPVGFDPGKSQQIRHIPVVAICQDSVRILGRDFPGFAKRFIFVDLSEKSSYFRAISRKFRFYAKLREKFFPLKICKNFYE